MFPGSVPANPVPPPGASTHGGAIFAAMARAEAAAAEAAASPDPPLLAPINRQQQQQRSSSSGLVLGPRRTSDGPTRIDHDLLRLLHQTGEGLEMELGPVNPTPPPPPAQGSSSNSSGGVNRGRSANNTIGSAPRTPGRQVGTT